jgi:hypothetical protein
MTERLYESPILIYGATFAGLGLAYRLGKQAIVIERSSLVGHEFINSYNPGKGLENEPSSEIGKCLHKELAERNLLQQDGRVHLPGISPMLFHFIRKHELSVLLMTEITEVKKTDDGFEVTLYNTSGSQTMRVRDIIDTTSTCTSKPSMKFEMTGKRINAILDGPSLTEPIKDSMYGLIQGGFSSEIYLKLDIQPEDQWAAAREKLHRFWMNRPERLQPWKLAAVADTFEIRLAEGPYPLEDGRVWLPSCAYSNLMEAFEAGISYAEQEVVRDAVI